MQERFSAVKSFHVQKYTSVPRKYCDSSKKIFGSIRKIFRYIPSEHSSYYDTSGSYYNLMTDSQHSVEEPQPRVLAKQVQELLQEEVS